MINNNKILTVSYGTFSCTLEGFEDSFGTMTAIAEYFRDLSAGDRYFGSEPVQPDADMLAHIAQQEIARHVEARQEEGGIVLRAADAPADTTLSPADVAAPVATVAAATLASQLPSAPAASEQPQDNLEDLEQDAAYTDEDTAAFAPAEPEDTSFFAPPPPPDEDFVVGRVDPRPAVDPASVLPPEDSIASKLQRIRAVVSRGDAPAMTDTFAEDEHSDSLVEDTQADLEAALDADDAFALTEEEAADTAELDDVHGLLGRLNGDTEAEELALAEAEAAEREAEAARLEAEAKAAEEEAEAARIAAEAEKAEAEAAEAEAAKLEAAAKAAEEEAEAAKVAAEAEAAKLEAEAKAAEEEAEAARVAAEAEQAEAEAAEAEAAKLEAEAKAAEEEAEAARIAAEAEIQEDDSADILANIAAASDTAEPVEAQVIKVSQSDLDAALTEGDLEEIYDDDDMDDEPVDLSAFVAGDQGEDGTDDYVPSSLSADEEAALLRELAEVESSLVTDEDDIEEVTASDETLETMEELENEVQSYTSASESSDDIDEATAFENAAELETAADADIEDQSYDTADDTVSVAESLVNDGLETSIADSMDDSQDDEGRAAARLGDADGEDLSRLMDKAASEMEEPDNSSRRDAFSHLRAAVAATKADKILGKGADEATEQNEYRKDLQQDLESVTPRRPSSTTARTERPNTDRPAPLKLVAEQRVDVESARPSGPVQPRRVATTVADPIAADASSFADYAESMGANKLPELLEAAASYMAYVEGRDQFSRPQLMTKVRQVEQDHFSREDGLRSFGQLLRAGKIEKIKGGRFTVSDQIGFKPDEREAG